MEWPVTYTMLAVALPNSQQLKKLRTDMNVVASDTGSDRFKWKSHSNSCDRPEQTSTPKAAEPKVSSSTQTVSVLRMRNVTTPSQSYLRLSNLKTHSY